MSGSSTPARARRRVGISAWSLQALTRQATRRPRCLAASRALCRVVGATSPRRPRFGVIGRPRNSRGFSYRGKCHECAASSEHASAGYSRAACDRQALLLRGRSWSRSVPCRATDGANASPADHGCGAGRRQRLTSRTGACVDGLALRPIQPGAAPKCARFAVVECGCQRRCNSAPTLTRLGSR
jgi:hypothetical protein